MDNNNLTLINNILKITYESLDEISEMQWQEISATEGLPYNFIIENADRLSWTHICSHQKLTEEFIDACKDYVDWSVVCSSQKLSEQFISKFESRVHWHNIAKYQTLSESFIRKYINVKLPCDIVSRYQTLTEDFVVENIDKLLLPLLHPRTISNLSEDFIRKHYTKLSQSSVSRWAILSEEFIEEFSNYVLWFEIAAGQVLSEEFVHKHMKQLRPHTVFKYQHLSEKFIETHVNEYEHLESADILWNAISSNQKLSIDFMRKHAKHMWWGVIAKTQKLTEEFMMEFESDMFWSIILKYQKLSVEFIKKNIDKFNNIEDIGKYQKLPEDLIMSLYGTKIHLYDNWLYKDEEFKKQQVVNCGLYECHEDYFIAYKGIRRDRFSKYNFQYQYNKGGIYESHADHTDAIHSFGLSVWTETGASVYSFDKIVKCKVYYKDVARLVENSNKLRCTKIEILD